jgi:CDP-glucose 4,6-dehydratase
MTPEFWQGKTVLVTGHTGFKGAWTCRWLATLGARVVGYSIDRPSSPCLYDLLDGDNDVVSEIADVRDLETLRATFRRHSPDIVLHMAAQSLVRRSYQAPLETLSTNVLGTANVLEAARLEPSARAVIVVTSDKCYENSDLGRPFSESDPMGGYDPYSASKGAAELVTAAWRRSYFDEAGGVGIASVRAGNVIGGGDFAQDRIVPDIINAFEAQHRVPLRNPAATRPWQFVLEPLHGYLTLAQALYQTPERYAGGWNFGPREEDVKPVSWLTDALAERWGDGAGWVADGANHPHEASRLTLDCAKARLELAWQPVLTLAQTLDWIVEWYRAFFDGQSIHAVTTAQINRYQTALSHV